ncbi:molybdenum cofactor guanylyltransferase [Methanobacterium sp. ACI-7]|uniref:molybdenum cofactor guanylyltransferase n=1 Tax=unclassified Methanobacterium TaxID=2627676 RepID=UPI0039C0AEB6
MKSIIILCGGRSKRMGRDKGSLILKGKPMILHILDEITDIADEIIIVLRDENQIRDYSELIKEKSNIKIITDKSKDQGPLIGILTGLSNIKSEHAQILPCDSPFISKKFVLKMSDIIETSNFDAVVPIDDDGHTEPLHSIYKKNAINIINELVNEEKRDVNSLIKRLNAKFINVKELDKSKMSFRNINTKKEINYLKQ